jgi:hypothetical protein
VYSEIIQIDANLSFILYYEYFSPGRGTNGRINANREEQILIENEGHFDSPKVASISDNQEETKDYKGFRIQLKKMTDRKNVKTLLDVIIMDESTMTSEEKLIDTVWNEFMENYKLMQTLIEDTKSSSLFSQLISKSTLSDSEEELSHTTYINNSVTPTKDLIKSRQVSLNTPTTLSTLAQKRVLLFRHSFLDESEDKTAVVANLWLEEGEVSVKTYDCESGRQDELFLGEEMGEIEEIRERVRQIFQERIVLERDLADGQYKLLLLPPPEISSDTIPVLSVPRKYDISFGISL